MAFIFDATKGETPDTIKRKRDMVRALMQAQRAPQNVGEGLNALGDGIVAAVLDNRAGKAERAGMESAAGVMQSLIPTFPPAPNPGNSTSMATMPAPDTASARVAQAHGDSDLRSGILSTADALGIDPADLATAISYETAGTFDPTKRGPTTQWGQHRGLIQFGEPQAKKYGVDWNNPVVSQLGPNGAVANYLRDTGVQPGMGLLDIYSAINAGGVGRYNRSDANNGGAPGTVADKVNNQMAGHRQKALALLGNAPSSAVSPQPSNGLTSEALQAWGQQNYAPAQGGAVGAVNALGNAQPVGVAETESDILAQERAMMGQDPQAFQQPGTGPRVAAPMQQPVPPMPPPQMVQDRPVAGVGSPVVQALQQAAQPEGLPEMAGRSVRPQTSPTVQQLMQAAQNPWLNDGQRAVVNLLLEQQLQQNDPMRQMQLEKGRLELEQLRNPQTQMTDTQRNLAWRAQQAGLQPGTQEYADFMRTGGGKDGVTVNNIMGGEKFGEEFAKGDAQALSAVSEAGLSAQRNLSRIDRLGEILAATPQGAMASWQQIAGQYGLNTEGLSNIQAAQALINSLVPEQRPPGSGPMSDADLELFKQSLPRIINQPGGNGIILNTMRAIAQYDAQGAEIVQALRRGELDRATAFEALQSRENPLAMLNDIPRQQEPAAKGNRTSSGVEWSIEE